MRPDDPFGPQGFAPGSFAAWTQGADPDLTERDVPAERYRIGGELGRGGMGVVQAATDAWLGREVAVKRPRPDVSEAVRRRTMREAAVTARLVHPSIVPIYDVGEDDEGPFYTMPVLVGESLEASLQAGARDLAAHVRAVAEVARAVGYAHTLGFLHRDLKPANVLLGHFGEVWVLDWGVAYDPSDPDQAAVGTRGYAAPEQQRGGPLTAAADVFGLGRVLAEVLAAHDPPHPELQAIVDRATAADPAGRYPDGSAFAEELERWLEGRRVHAHAYSAREVLWRWVRARRAPLLVAATAVVVGAMAGGAALRAQRAERARGDAALAASLAQQSLGLYDEQAQAEAEVLAAHALTYAEHPVARGLWAHTRAASGPRVVAEVPLPCDRTTLSEDGEVLCVGDQIARRRGTAEQVLAAGEDLDGDVIRLRVHGDAVLVQRAATNDLELWRGAERKRVAVGSGAYLGLAGGPEPAVFDRHRVGRVDLATGAVAWQSTGCDRIEAVWASASELAVACREAVGYGGTWAELGPPIGLPAGASTVSWLDGPLFGTFDGQLVSAGSDGVRVYASGVGAPVQLAPVDDAIVAVVGERGRARLWRRDTGAFVGAVPGPVRVVGAHGGGLRVLGEQIRQYALPDALSPITFDRTQAGGIAFLEVSRAGDRLIAGSGSGEVVVLDVATGAATVVVEQGSAAAKGRVFVDPDTVAISRLPSETVVLDWRTGTPLHSSPFFTRVATRLGPDGALGMPYGPTLQTYRRGGWERLDLPARPVAISRGPEPWVVDEQGGLWAVTAGGLDERMRLDAPVGRFARFADGIVAVEGDALTRFAADGTRVWEWKAPAGLTSVDAGPDAIVVGDALGHVALLDADGAVRFRVASHERLVSAVLLVGDALYSAGWDGRIHRYDLTRVDDSPERVLAMADGSWALTLEQVLD